MSSIDEPNDVEEVLDSVEEAGAGRKVSVEEIVEEIGDRSFGPLLLVPAIILCSPDLNPIELSFSKLKANLRKAAARTIPRLRRRIGRFAATLTAREASNYFWHAGYE
jgi:transposase